MATKKATSSMPKKVYKGSRTIEHDLFKLQVATAKHNKSWHYKNPDIVGIEHCHFFHSINDRTGQPNKHCTKANGHFHEITVDWSKTVKKEVTDAHGKTTFIEGPQVTCGPPLKVAVSKIPGRGVVKQNVPVVHERHTALGGDIVDEHTHDVFYIESEEINLTTRDEKRSEERKKAQGMFEHSESTLTGKQAGEMERLKELEQNNPGLLQEA